MMEPGAAFELAGLSAHLLVASELSAIEDGLFCDSSTIAKARVIPDNLNSPAKIGIEERSLSSTNSFPFLSLPGELRNKIYSYALPQRHYRIRWFCNSSKLGRLTSNSEAVRRPRTAKALAQAKHRRQALRTLRSPVFRRAMVDIYVHRPIIPLGLLYVSCQVSAEAAPIFYGQSSFDFASLGSARFFLNHLRSVSRLALRSLCLRYSCYGHSATYDKVARYLKGKADHNAEALFWQIQRECPRLIHLRLCLDIGRTTLAAIPKIDFLAETELENQIALGCLANSFCRPSAEMRWIRTLPAVKAMDLSSFYLEFVGAVQPGIELTGTALALVRQVLSRHFQCSNQAISDNAPGQQEPSLSVGEKRERQTKGTPRPSILLLTNGASCATNTEAPQPGKGVGKASRLGKQQIFEISPYDSGPANF